MLDKPVARRDVTVGSPAMQATDQVLTVNQKGEVIKARYQLRINDASQWSDKVFRPTYPLRPLATVASYIDQLKQQKTRIDALERLVNQLLGKK